MSGAINEPDVVGGNIRLLEAMFFHVARFLTAGAMGLTKAASKRAVQTFLHANPTPTH